MAVHGVNPKCYILALFVRDDEERFLLGDGPYEFKDKQLHFQPNTVANDVVEVQGNDGYLLAGQVRRPGVQAFDGYVGMGTTDKATVETQRRAFFQFFRRGHFYKVIYVFPNGTAIQRKQGFLVDDPTVQELYQQYPEYHVALNFEDVNYYTYEEDSEGHEIYAKEAIIKLTGGGAKGGLIWDSVGVVWEESQWGGEETVDATAVQIDNQLNTRVGIHDTQLKGDTYQQTYSGKNLCGIPNQTFTHADVSVTIQDGEITLNGTANTSATYNLQPISTTALNGTYTTSLIYVSGNISNTTQSNLNVRYSDTTSIVSGSQGTIRNENSYRTWSVENANVIFGLYLSNGTVYDNVKFKYQITAGSSPGYSYEPYVGGIPAPNPDYPQPIQVVTGEQTVTIGDGGGQSATYKVDLTGKNIIDGSYDGITSFTRCTGERSGNGFKITSIGQSGAVYATIPVPNYNEFLEKTVTLSYDGIGSNVNASCYYLASDGKTPSSSYLNNISSGTPFTFPSSIPAGSTGVCLVFYSSVNNNTTYNNIQLELGSTATPYTPYYNYELCKISDYQDYIYNSGDDWYVHKEVDKYVFDGDESWRTTPYGTNSWILDNVIYFNFVSNKIQIMSNIATGIAHADRNTTTPNVMYSGQNNVFNFRNTSFTTLSALQTATKDSYVYYAIATPTDTKITDATLVGQLEAFDGMRLYVGENNIQVLPESGTDNLPAIAHFKYYTTLSNTGAEWEEGGTSGATIVEVDAIDNTYPLWELVGPSVNPTLTMLTTNTTLVYNGTISSSQKLVIDMFNKTATLNGTSVIGNVSGDWTYMAPGTNRVAYTAGNTDAPDSTIYWQEVVG